MKKMYIAVLDQAPDYMVPTLVAHSVLNAHEYFTRINSVEDLATYYDWMENSFRKVVVRVGRPVFDKIRTTLVCHEGHENTICNAGPSCLVVLPVESDNVPKVLQYCTLWKPLPPPVPEQPKPMQVDYRSMPQHTQELVKDLLAAKDFYKVERYFKAHAALESGLYVVQPGDTLSGIGHDVGIDWRYLAQLNALANPHLIFPGQLIKLR